jgi:hypothetical protein
MLGLSGTASSAVAGWEAWMVSVETALTLACGPKGSPISYVIRAQDAPDLNGFGQLTWEESAIVGTPLLGLDCHADRTIVHLFTLNNIGEDSDACACVQPILRRNDGRRDIVALWERCDNDATIQTRANEANKTWDMLVHKNFQKALQHFERANRVKHNGDVIDWIWNHVQNSEQVKASTLGHQIRSYKKSRKKSPISARGPLSNNVFPKFMQDPTAPSKGTLLHQVPFPAMENYFAVLTRIGTGSATSSRNIALKFWNSENSTQNISQMVAPAAEERAVVAPTDATRQATNTRSRLWRNKMRTCK